MNDNKVIGSRIKSLREMKQISLADMAERTGLDIEQVERIEQDKNLPSLTPLIKIARALGVRLGTFLDDNDELGPVVSRKDKYQQSISFSTNQTSSHKHMDYYALSHDKAGRHMEPFMIRVEPADDGVQFLNSSHEGEEFIFCMEGALEVTYGTETYVLEEGDSIYYDSIVAHHVHAADERGARILAIVYTPI